MATSAGFIFLISFIKDDISTFANKKYNFYNLPQLIIYIFLIVMPFSYQVWEKYLLPVLPFYAIVLVNKFGRISKDDDMAEDDVLLN